MLSWALLQRATQRDLRSEFSRRADFAQSFLEGRMLAYEQLARAASGFVRVSRDPAGEWRTYVVSLDLRRLGPGARGLALLERDSASGTPRLLTFVTADGRTTDPAMRNLGDSLAPTVRSLARRGATMSGPVGRSGRYADVVAMVVDVGDARHLVAVVLDIAGVLGEAADSRLMGMDLEVYDGPDSTGPLLYDTDRNPNSLRSSPPLFEVRDDITLAGRHWALYASVEGDSEGWGPRYPWLVMIGGVFFTVLLAGWVGLQQRLRSAAEEVARLRAEEASTSQAALGETADRYRSVVERSPIGLAIAVDQRWVLVNPEFMRIVGASSADQLLGHPIQDRVAPAFRTLAQERIASLADGADSTPPLEEEFLRLDGTSGWVEVSSTNTRYEGQPAIQVMARDVTERRRAARDLADSQARLVGIIDSAMDGIITVDASQRVVLFNASAERIFGVAAADAMGQPLDRFIPASFRDRHRQWVQDFAATGVTRRGMGRLGNISGLRASGEEFPLEASISYTRTGQQALCTVILRDVSDQRDAASRQSRLEAQLRQAQKMEAIGTLAGGIAHDFNNILGAILGNAELLLEDLPEDGPAREETLEVVTAGNRAKELVRRILSFSRPEDQERQPIHLDSVLRESVKLMRATLPSTIELKIEIREASLRVLADPTQLGQVILNLGTNAAHAIGEGSGWITISAESLMVIAGEPVHGLELAPGRYVRLEVSDSGCGMDSETQERMFEPFFTTKAPGMGTGLGLSVVHGIVRSHDGAIAVRSTVGEGTTFTLLLPAFEGAIGDGEEEVHGLQRLGYTPVATRLPTQAVEMLRLSPNSIDLVLTDLTMPGMTGIELAGRLLEIRPDLPIILSTGYGSTVTENGLKARGLRRLLHKPVSLKMLAEALVPEFRANGGGGGDGARAAG
jgi:PAS domain S-box-containing protein